MKNIIKQVSALSIILVLILFSSCRKEVKFDISDPEKSLVLNAILKNDSTIAVRVSFLKSLSQGDTKEPATALVQLFRNGEWVEDLKPELLNGYRYYTGSSVLSRGNNYTVKATVEGYPNVEGTNVIPESAKISDERLELVSTPNEGDKLNIVFHLDDPEDHRNYYRLRIWGREYWDPDNVDTQLYRKYFSFKSAGFGEQSFDGFDEEYDEYYFSDDLLKSASQEIRMEFYGGPPFDTSAYILEVTSFSEDAYRYFKSKSDAQYHNDDPFTEPSVIHSNIKNGLGIVGGIAYRRASLRR